MATQAGQTKAVDVALRTLLQHSFRRFAGLALCGAGVLLLSFVATRLAAGNYRASQARAAWDAADAERQVALARARAGSPIAPAEVVTGAPVARLAIPRIGLDEIIVEGVGDDELNAGPGHLPGSVLPGMNGNAIISAHRDRHFHRLGELQLGDTISTESAQSAGLWVVVSRRVVGSATPALFDTSTPTLTLTTCWPIRYLGTAPDRLIITARPLAQQPGQRRS